MGEMFRYESSYMRSIEIKYRINTVILGYPWYPALIYDADAEDEPILHGDEELPQPSYDTIEFGNELNRNQKGGISYNLVLFFDARRTL